METQKDYGCECEDIIINWQTKEMYIDVLSEISTFEDRRNKKSPKYYH